MHKLKHTSILLLFFAITGCIGKQQADMLLFNGHIQTVDSLMTEVEAMVVSDGLIVFTGSREEAIKKFECREQSDLGGAYVYPGFNDAHSHFYGLGGTLVTVDLTGTKSWDEVIDRCRVFSEKHHPRVLTGRGWDQNDWEVQKFPTNEKLNELFPGIPVLLRRIDGHAAIANNKLLQMAGLNAGSVTQGGEIIKEDNRLTGVLVDNAVDIAEKVLPQPERADIVKALMLAQEVCLAHGLTTVCDAGLDKTVIDIIDSLQKAGALKIRVYAMISATDANLDHYLKQQPYKTGRLNVSSFKIYGDGALGSRGACLLAPYHDKHDHYGFVLTPLAKMKSYAERIAANPYQLNTHCIGDSASRFILDLYGSLLPAGNDRRWRIEHAQVINADDFGKFGRSRIIPSVQPTHATSDMYWIKDRLGEQRIKNACAYKTLLKQNGWLPLGTDFPVEAVNPMYTIYAAVSRQDAAGYPEGGFQAEEALTREEALKGITTWPAKAAFEETQKGSLEVGKFADFVIMKADLLKEDLKVLREARPVATYINGEKVF